MKQYYIVWNANRTEGYITDDYDDADAAACEGGTSTVGLAFYEAYGEDVIGGLDIQEVQL